MELSIAQSIDSQKYVHTSAAIWGVKTKNKNRINGKAKIPEHFFGSQCSRSHMAKAQGNLTRLPASAISSAPPSES